MIFPEPLTTALICLNITSKIIIIIIIDIQSKSVTLILMSSKVLMCVCALPTGRYNQNYCLLKQWQRPGVANHMPIWSTTEFFFKWGKVRIGLQTFIPTSHHVCFLFNILLQQSHYHFLFPYMCHWSFIGMKYHNCPLSILVVPQCAVRANKPKCVRQTFTITNCPGWGEAS